MIKFKLVMAVALTASMLGATRAGEPGEDGFSPLFNGKDFTGIKFILRGDADPAKTFKVKDEVLCCTGKPPGYWYTVKNYKDFTLRFDYRYKRPDDLVDDSKFRGNSGYLLFIEKHGIWPRSCEIQGHNKSVLRLIGIKGWNGKAEVDNEARKRALKPVGQWNAIEIVSKDGVITSSLNGVRISVVTAQEEVKSGPIGFQSEGAEIHWRNIRIKEHRKFSKAIRVLIIDGQNNHRWQTMTPFMKPQMEKTGRFKVDVSTSPPAKPRRRRGKPAAQETPEQVEARKKAWATWRPAFKDYQVIVSNYNGEPWPEEVQRSFEEYVKGGGGVLIVHAANNAFPQWKEYNKMIGLGWRNNKFGPRVYYDGEGKLVRAEPGEGPGAGHGPQHVFQVMTRDADHPITKGFPKLWMHCQDELYHGQRGPAANMRILASAFSKKDPRGTGVHEPMLWVIPYGEGQVVTNVMGHENGKSLRCVGFITIMNRALEWLATGKVTIPVPDNFPTAEKPSAVEGD